MLGGVSLDITARKQAEEELRGIPKRLLDTQEAERRRVARELHDGISQLLASVRSRMAAFLEKKSGRQTAEIRTLHQLDALLERASQEVQRIAWNLRPSELDDLGLLATIRSFSADFRRRTGLLVNVYLPRAAGRLPPDIELALYRILQEALNNIEKHAAATQVEIRLTAKDQSVHLSIKDNGRGFAAANPKTVQQKFAGMGLINMRERVGFHHGTIDKRSAPSHGVEIQVRIPLETVFQKEATRP